MIMKYWFSEFVTLITMLAGQVETLRLWHNSQRVTVDSSGNFEKWIIPLLFAFRSIRPEQMSGFRMSGGCGRDVERCRSHNWQQTADGAQLSKLPKPNWQNGWCVKYFTTSPLWPGLKNQNSKAPNCCHCAGRSWAGKTFDSAASCGVGQLLPTRQLWPQLPRCVRAIFQSTNNRARFYQ